MIHPRILSILQWDSFLATGFSSPNPPVAALATDIHGKILEHAYTQKTGSNHAERELYEKLKKKMNPIPEHILYLTLEPCTHYGKTPPCSNLILEYKPNQLIIGHKDPNPLVEKESQKILKNYFESNIKFIFSNELKDISKSFLNGFFQRIQHKKPKIILKSVVTKEGYYAPNNKNRTQISSNELRPFLQLLRAKVDAIMVGIGTIIHDKPSLTFEGIENLDLMVNVSPWEESIDIGFWDSLYEFSKYKITWEHHIEKINDYQPYRIFLIPQDLELNLLDEFLYKQKKIQERYPNSKCIFLIIEKIGIKNNKLINTLENFTNIYYISESNLVDSILSILTELGVNLLVVEGGNFLYSLFYPILNKDDDILIIQNNSISWNNGYQPMFWNQLKKLKWKKNVNSSESIMVFQKESY